LQTLFPTKEERQMSSGILPDYYPEKNKAVAAVQVEQQVFI